MLGCAVILWSRISLRISNLRLLEIAVLMNVGIFGVVINIRSILFEASIGDVADVVGANAYNYHTWTLIILVYGTFMPNSWERAAAILVPCASIPYLVTFGVSLWSDSNDQPLPYLQYR